jgi:hypothetical protein
LADGLTPTRQQLRAEEAALFHRESAGLQTVVTRFALAVAVGEAEDEIGLRAQR